MGSTPFTEVVHIANAPGRDDQALRAIAGDMMVDSPERMHPEKVQTFSDEIALAETVRGGLAESAGGDSLLPMASGSPSSLVPVGTLTNPWKLDDR